MLNLVVLMLLVGSYLAFSHLLMVWAALAERPHWFWRLALVLGWIALTLVPEGDDVGILLLLEAALILPGAAILARFAGDQLDPAKRSRFQLAELGLFMAVVAAGLALMLRMNHTCPPIAFIVVGSWQATLLLCAVFTSLVRTWRWKLAGLVSYAALAALGLFALPQLRWFQELFQMEGPLSSLVLWENVPAGYGPFYAAALCLPSTAIALLLLVLLRSEFSARRRLTSLCRAAALVGVGCVCCSTAWIGYRLSVPAPLPPIEMPEPNAYQAVLDLDPKWADYDFVPNRREHGDKASQAFLEVNKQEIERVGAAMATPGKVILHKGLEGDLDAAAAVRSMARALRLLAEYEPPEERILIGRDLLRLAQRTTVGGVYFDHLMARIPVTMGVELIASQRTTLELATCQALLEELQSMEDAWEPDEIIRARDSASVTWWANWSSRLAWLATVDQDESHYVMLRSTWHGTLASLRLLQAELALRAYYLENNRWPGQLEELVPRYLQRVPLDPFVAKPLIYRTTNNGYLLYSVADNRVDDGGNFVTSMALATGAPGDMSVDIYKLDRPAALVEDPPEEPQP